MNDRIVITEADRERLRKMIDEQLNNGCGKTKAVAALVDELHRAAVVPPQALPGNVISMNTRALLHMNGAEVEVSLVYPQDADWASRKVSVLSPVGTALLGYSEGETIEWEVPSGRKEIHIRKILYQPEAAGDWNL